ncbi:hypothetical protein HNY73_003329 [Argiope bruennichi]|uniref:Uncharacterized protein n=1 Tax=Argiope bruennichi TaxID=94029 RepID=A0A8T0FYZ4_ARGBR|nr:hypothetical protein HNY73_003329 [Argiope bruennichi]
MAGCGNGELLALLAEMKKSMEAGQEEMKQGQKRFEKEMCSGQERMEEMKAGLEKEMRSIQERMEEMKAGLEKEIRSVQERMEQELKKDIVSVKEEFSNIVQEKMNAIEDKVASFENKVVSVETKVLKMEECIDKVQEDIGKEFEQKFGKEIESLKKQIFHEHEESKGDAADILETLRDQRHDFQALSSALELRFGEKCTKEYSRLQLNSRYQKAGESLQELAADIQRLSHLAFSDYPIETRQDLALQHFIDSVRDPETQKALRLADVKDIGSALIFAHKIEVARQPHARTDTQSELSLLRIRTLISHHSFGLHAELESSQKIIAKTDISLSPRTECVIPGLVADNRKFRFGVMDYPDTGRARAGMLVASSVVDLSKSVIKVRVANISYKTKILQKGEVLATCTPVTCIERMCKVRTFLPDDLVQNLLQDTDLDETGMLNFKKPEGQIARWIQRLQEYDMEIRHRKGSAHGHADALSRRPCSENCNYCSTVEKKFAMAEPVVCQVITPSTSESDPWSDESTRKDQLAVPEIKPIIEFKESTGGKPSWQDIAPFHPTTKRYWAL